MKSRQEFTNESDFQNYLKYYYAGQAMTALIMNKNAFNILTTTQNAVETANQMVMQLAANDKEEREYKDQDQEAEIPPREEPINP